MKQQYLLRLDDACATMYHAKWEQMEEILDKYGIKPMAGVIPYNEDPKQIIENEDFHFWDLVHKWENKGWAIALHGYNHVYSSKKGGMNPFWNKSEFAGHSLELQREKIRKGVEIMREHGINPKYFFAPSHTFDENTLEALRDESDVRIISDTIAFYPYKYKDFVFIPQLSGQCREMRLNGLYTFCYHPNTMSDSAFEKMEVFIKEHQSDFVSFDTIKLDSLHEKSFLDKILSFCYFSMRKIRKKI